MGKASISIAISALWNGSSQIDKAVSDFKKLDRLVSQQQSSLTQSLAQSGRSWQEWGGKVHDMGTKVAGLGDSISKAVTVPMIAMGTYGVKSAVDFDTALANLRKTSDLTSSQLEEMAQGALDMSTTQPVDAKTILNVEALGAQLGISNDRLEDFAKTVTGLDIATNMDAETAATEMARFANIVGMAETEFSNYGSTIVAIGNNMATTESEVSQMAQRFASAGHQAGLSEAEILGMSAAMSSLGIKAEMGGSALSQVFVSISKAVALGGDKLDAFAAAAGMSAEEFRAAWQEDAASAFETLLQKIHDASEAGTDMNVILGELGITQIRQSDVMRRMAGSVDKVSEALDLSTQAWEQNTALQAEVDQRNESLASRLQVLKNRLDEVAITVGRPLADALISAMEAADPLIQAVADAADAFAEMDEEGQRNVLMWAGVAAAAGPVLSVLGRVMQGAGNLASAFGRMQSAVAVYGDALGTLDGAHLRVYSATDKLSTNLGVAGNRAVKSAGSVERYVSAWEGMYDSARRVSSAEKQLTAANKALEGATGKTRKSLEGKVTALRSEIAVAQQSFAENGKLVSAYGKSTQEVEKYAKGVRGLQAPLQTVKAEFGSVAASSDKMSKSFGSSVKSFATGAGSFVRNAASMGAAIVSSAGPMIAITALTAVVGTLVGKWQEAEAHAKLVADATRGAGEVMGNARAGAEGLGDAIGTLSADVDGVLQGMADLNASVTDTFLDVEKDQAKLDQYVGAIQELANQSGLTAAEQWRLQQAVEGYNSITGDSVSVTDAANGKLSDANGTIMESTDLINQNAEAWRQRATAQAYSSVASQYLEQEVTAAYNLRVAQEELAAAKERYAELSEKGASRTLEETQEFIQLTGKVGELEGNVSDLSSAYETAAASSQYFSDMATVSATTLSDNVKNAIQALPQELSGTGVAIASSLAAGIESGAVSAEDAARLVSEGVGDAIASMPDEARPYGQAAADAVAGALANGQLSVSQAVGLLKDAAGRDMSTWGAMFSAKGLELPANLAGAIQMNSLLPASATQAMKDAVILKLAGGDVTLASQMLGRDIDAGLADGIMNGTLSEAQAAALGEEVIAKAKETLQSHSPSLAFQQIGSDVDAGLANGISGNTSGPLGAIGELGSSLIEAISGVPDEAKGIGSSASSGMSAGLAAGTGSVRASATGLYASATSGVSGTPGQLSSYGDRAGSLFASGIGAFTRQTLGAAMGLYDSAIDSTMGTPDRLSDYGESAGTGYASGLRASVYATGQAAGQLSSAASRMRDAGNSYTWGSHLASNFASGIRAGLGWVSSAARNIANAAKNILGFSVPEDGPWSGMERGGETSGLHLAQNWARGIEAGIPAVGRAAERAALAASPSFPQAAHAPAPALSASGPAQGQGSVTYHYELSINGVRLASEAPRAQELIRELVGSFNLTSDMGA